MFVNNIHKTHSKLKYATKIKKVDKMQNKN